MRGLGELESAVMAALWSSAEPMRVRDVMDVMDAAQDVTRATVVVGVKSQAGKSLKVHRTMGTEIDWIS